MSEKPTSGPSYTFLERAAGRFVDMLVGHYLAEDEEDDDEPVSLQQPKAEIPIPADVERRLEVAGRRIKAQLAEKLGWGKK